MSALPTLALWEARRALSVVALSAGTTFLLGLPGLASGEFGESYRFVYFYLACCCGLSAIPFVVFGLHGKHGRREPPPSLLLAGVRLAHALWARALRLALSTWLALLPVQALAALTWSAARALLLSLALLALLCSIAVTSECAAARKSHGLPHSDSFGVGLFCLIVVSGLALEALVARERSLLSMAASIVVRSHPALDTQWLMRLVETIEPEASVASFASAAVAPQQVICYSIASIAGCVAGIASTTRAIARLREES